MQFEDKIALIVGGTGSIGEATAAAFAAGGARVVVAGRNEDSGRRIVADLREDGAEALFVAADVTRSESIASLVETVVAEYGRLDCAFNNAGWEGAPAPTAEIEEADWNRMLDIKLTGVWRGMKYQIPQMTRQGGGAIVNMAGNWGLVAAPAYASYCAAAHGIMGLTKTAALEYAGSGVRINAVCPGAVDTPLLDRMVGGDAGVKQAFAEQLAIGRIADPREVAQAVVWLCSDAASYVSGEGLALTGGG